MKLRSGHVLGQKRTAKSKATTPKRKPAAPKRKPAAAAAAPRGRKPAKGKSRVTSSVTAAPGVTSRVIGEVDPEFVHSYTNATLADDGDDNVYDAMLVFVEGDFSLFSHCVKVTPPVKRHVGQVLHPPSHQHGLGQVHCLLPMGQDGPQGPATACWTSRLGRSRS